MNTFEKLYEAFKAIPKGYGCPPASLSASAKSKGGFLRRRALFSMPTARLIWQNIVSENSRKTEKYLSL